MNKKTQKLTKGDRKMLRAFIKSFETMQEAADALCIGRSTLHNISNIGSGSPDNISKIREAINVSA